jgi:hypothetical protein
VVQNRSNSGKASAAIGAAMPIPSQVPTGSGPAGKGVETRRAAPTAGDGYGEGIVQTTNTLGNRVAAKAVVVRKSAFLEEVRVRVPPSAPTFSASIVKGRLPETGGVRSSSGQPQPTPVNVMATRSAVRFGRFHGINLFWLVFFHNRTQEAQDVVPVPLRHTLFEPPSGGFVAYSRMGPPFWFQSIAQNCCPQSDICPSRYRELPRA